ncbi:hypothetical protein GCM10009610_31260 [Pseudonocardia xinjiangensis]
MAREEYALSPATASGRVRGRPTGPRTLTWELTDDEWESIEPFLPIGTSGPYPEHLREQFEGVIWKFRSGARWRESHPRPLSAAQCH